MVNVQTERIENHIARLTVEVEDNVWEQAKKRAAKNLSKRYRIPGFRKGKAPYNVIVRYLGEGSIIENAVEDLGNNIYRDALAQSEVDPYAAGSLEDFQLEPKPTYIFTVPLQPEVDLQEYRAVRLDFEAPQITEELVDQALRRMQHSEAELAESNEPVKAGDRITIHIHSTFADDAPESGEDDQEQLPQKGENFLHRHDMEVMLDPELEPILPGFIDAIVGTEAEAEIEFDLPIPDDDPDYEQIQGRTIHFEVTVLDIQTATLPELNDEFAANIAELEGDVSEEEPPTLAQLRTRTRENLEAEALREAEEAYANKVLGDIVNQATITFPDVMVSDRVHDMMEEFDRSLQQKGMNLESYQQITGLTHEEFHEQYHDDAVASLQRSLVLGELMLAEKITLDSDEINARIEETLAQFGEQAEMFRQFLDTPEQRQNIANSLLYDRVMARLTKIGRGEAPDLDSLEQSETEETETAEKENVEVTAEAEAVDTIDAAEEETTSDEEEQSESEEDETTDE